MLLNMAKVRQFEARVICKYLHNLLIPGSLPTALPCLLIFLKNQISWKSGQNSFVVSSHDAGWTEALLQEVWV